MAKMLHSLITGETKGKTTKTDVSSQEKKQQLRNHKQINKLHGFRASKVVESKTATMNSISRACKRNK